MIVLVAGGDRRTALLAEKFAAEGHRVYLLAGDPDYPAPAGVKPLDYLFWVQEQPDLLLLPIPVSRDGVRLTQKANREEIKLSHLLDLCRKDTAVAGGMLSGSFKTDCKKRGLVAFDYGSAPAFYAENCRLTALGALEILQKRCPHFGKGNRVLVTGFGGCSKALTELLLQKGAEVIVAARKPSAWAEAEKLGALAVGFPLQKEPAKKLTAVVNTVPAVVLWQDFLSALPDDAFVLELASTPGSMADSLPERQFCYETAPGIPGRFFPEESAKAAFAAISDFLAKEETL